MIEKIFKTMDMYLKWALGILQLTKENYDLQNGPINNTIGS
jgi:hypothetical protein